MSGSSGTTRCAWSRTCRVSLQSGRVSGSSRGRLAWMLELDRQVRRNTLILAGAMAVYSSVLQLVAAVSSITFVLVTGVEGLLGLGPAIFLTASALTAVPAGRLMDRLGR